MFAPCAYHFYHYCDLICIPVPISIRWRIDPLERGSDSSHVLFGERLSVRIVDSFRVGAPVFNDAHFKLFSFEEFHIGRRSCLVPGKRNLSRWGIAVGMLARNSDGEMCRFGWVGDTARNLIEGSGRFP